MRESRRLTVALLASRAPGEQGGVGRDVSGEGERYFIGGIAGGGEGLVYGKRALRLLREDE